MSIDRMASTLGGPMIQGQEVATVFKDDGGLHAVAQVAETIDMRNKGELTTPETDNPRDACLATSTNVFYPEEESDKDLQGSPAIEAAKRICGQCVVREQCLEFAIKQKEKIGIWGGLTSVERRRLVRRRKRTPNKSS